MDENDTKMILEAINSLKKEQKKEIQMLKKEQEKIRKENQNIKKLLKSIHTTNNNLQGHNRNSEPQNEYYNSIDNDKAIINNMEIIDDYFEYDEFTPKKELYSLSKTTSERDTTNMDALKFKEDMELKKKNYDHILSFKKSPKVIANNDDKEIDDMSIISFLARSDKRVQILNSLNNSDKIPSMISKEIGDSSHHVSKYLKTLKEKELVVCLNEEDKRFRFYSITPKGKKYLKIIEEEKY